MQIFTVSDYQFYPALHNSQNEEVNQYLITEEVDGMEGRKERREEGKKGGRKEGRKEDRKEGRMEGMKEEWKE